jgi:uncharacterized protein YndB with AHSA1/START domain
MTGSQRDTRPDVPLRLELTFDVPGTPEQVWHAIATSDGISSWFLATEVEEREGGALVTHMGPETSSPGTVTGWDPPRRFAYEEPEWASLVGREGAPVTPLATEFLVEAQSGGTCVVRVVSSAFGTGADWEQEFFAEMEKGWAPWFEVLRLHLSSFAGRRATRLEAAADVPGTEADGNAAMRRALGVTEAGGAVETERLTARVESVGDMMTVVRLTGSMPGYLAFYAYDKGDGVTVAQVAGYLFSDDAEAFVEREAPAWKAWLEGLAVSTPNG